MTDAIALTPEDRAKQHGKTRRRFDRQFGKVRPGSYAFEVLKRASLGVYTDGFIYAGNLAYLALMTVFPFFIVAAAVLSLVGQSVETQRAVSSFLHVLPPNVGDILRKPIADVLVARTGSLLWLGGLVGLWTVGSFVETIRDIFRRAYGTTTTAPLWRARLGLSLAIVASVILALISFLVQGLLTAAEQFVYRLLPFAENAATWIGLSRIIPGAVMFGALYMLFYCVTPSKYRYSSSRKWPGALFTTAWWVTMTALLPFVLARLGGYDLTYGSLAGVVVMLLFFYLIGLGLRVRRAPERGTGGTPRRGSTGRRYGNGGDDSVSGLMAGKRGLIMGLANDKSLAWGIAQKLSDAGAELAFTYQGPAMEKRVRPLAEQLGASVLIDCDVSDMAALDAAFATLASGWQTIDFVVHAIGFSDKTQLRGRFMDTTLDNFLMTMNISVYSFVAVAQRAAKLMPEGGAMLTLSYYGAEKVIPHYNVMGVAKAALETSVKYLAVDLGRDTIRVNAISAGPIQTLAARGIGDFNYIMKWNELNSPLKRNVTIEDVGGAALYLLSDLASGVTGEVHHVDAGYNVIGMKAEDSPDIALV